jgi:undecaprenyl-diphosphatase
MTKGAITLSRSGDGYLQVLTPAVVWLSGSVLAPTYAVALAAAMLMERIVYYIMKNTLKRLRPCDFKKNLKSLIAASDKFSFPSGHTSAAFCFSTITILTFGGAFAAMFVWASLVGASRVIIGVHYPGDIVAGAVMGSGIAVATASMLNIW